MTDLEALGRRLVACKHFRPMRGMRDLQGRTWDEALLWRWSNEFDVPDLSDPATLGCVLALVRDTYGRANGQARRWSLDGWYWHADYADTNVSAKRLYLTEAEALVAALEAAPTA
jgi:hypothetical protein